MTFFKSISELPNTGTLSITFSNSANGMLTLIVWMQPRADHKSPPMLPPLKLTATAEDFDTHFFEMIAAPIKATADFQKQTEAYLKEVEVAKQRIKAEPSRSNKQQDNTQSVQNLSLSKEEKRKKYEAAIKEVERLNSRLKYEEAIAALPSIEEYPEKKQEIENLQADFQRKKKQMNLFQMEM